MTRKSVVRCTALLTVALAVHQLHAQWVPTRSFGVEDGLAQSQITAITQDAYGYLWIATQGGLSRYDGSRFMTFTRADGLPDDIVTALATDDLGRLWLGTDSGDVAVWNGENFAVLERNEPAPRVTCLHLLDDARLLVGTTHGLWLGSGDDSRLLLDEPVISIARGGSDLWILSDTVYRFENDELSPFQPVADQKEAAVVAIAPAVDGVWVADDIGGVFLYSTDGNRDRSASIDVPARTLLLATSDVLWIGSDNGLWSLHPDGDIDGHPLHPSNPNVEIHALYEDHENNLWVGTFSQRLHLLRPDACTVFNRESGLRASGVWSFLEDDNGCIWMATEDGGVIRWCPSGWSEHLQSGVDLPLGRCISLEQGESGDLWIATANGIVQRRGDGVQRVWTTSDGLPSDYTRVLLRDRDGVLWAASDRGLAAFENNRWQAWTRNDGMPDDNLRGLALDGEGRLWIATHSAGVVLFDGQNFTAFGTDAGLPHIRVWCVTIDSANRLWAGTDNGIWIHPIAGGTNIVVGADSGLPSVNILFLQEDADGLMWVGTTRGVSILDPEGRLLTTLTTDDGLTGTEAAENAVLLDSKGMMWMGMAAGATRLDPRHLPHNPTAPPLVLEKIIVNGASRAGTKPISATMVDSTDEVLVFEPRTTDLRFEFSALSFTSPDKVRYRFMLEGYDDVFGEPTEDNHVTYRRVPPGAYNFVLTARNSDDVWTTEALTVPIRLLPAWYQTLFFRLAILVILLATPAGAFAAYNANQKRRQRELERQVTVRTSELAEANQQITEQNRLLKDLSRTDPLTGLANRRVVEEIAPLEIALIGREVERLKTIRLARFHGIAFLMIDLDHFKRVNDAHGHDVGDLVLQATADTLRRTLREVDLSVRWGGEEFLILARSLDRQAILRMVERLLAEIAQVSVTTPSGEKIGITASIGFVTYPMAITDPISSSAWRSLVKVADDLMYLAKKQGRWRAYGLVPYADADGSASERDLLKASLAQSSTPTEGLELLEVLGRG